MTAESASDARERQLDGIELAVATLALGSLLGTLIYAATTGQRYEAGDSGSLRNPSVWLGIAVRIWFSLTSRVRWARVGWSLGAAVAVLTIVTPLGNPGRAAWAARAVATMAWTGIVATALGSTVNTRWATVASVVFFLGVGLGYWSLQNWDTVTGRSTVLWGE
jgi:hypothetical protein